MPRPIKFELSAYPGGDAEKPDVSYVETRDASSARGYAGRLAKRINGPVDLAYAYQAGEPAQDWADRYVTTAAPSEYHASGYRFERLEN